MNIEKQKSHEIKVAGVARGNTVAGVNEIIIRFLLNSGINFAGQKLLDAPCGDGAFLTAVNKYLPALEIAGADIKSPKIFPGKFFQIDARRAFEISLREKFNVITCISGVMEFDNTQAFFEQITKHLTADGLLIVTNDNLLTIRDRLLYLLFGRTKQYRLFIELTKPTWKLLTLQNLRRILWESGFEVGEIRYAPVSPAEWLWLPLALPIYFLQYLYLRFAENSSDSSFSERTKFLPLISMMSRHYVLVCRLRKPNN